MRFRTFSFTLFTLTTGATLVVVSAQAKKPAVAIPTPTPKPPDAPAIKNKGNVIIRNGTQGVVVWDDNNEVGRITKDVTVVQTGEDFILYAQELTYNKRKRTAIATGNLRVETRDSTIRSARIFADFNTKTITFTGSVTVSSHGKDDGITKGMRSKFQQKPSKIVCDRADWDYEARQATLTGNVHMKQEDNEGTCERILYDEPRNIAQLLGGVRFKDSKNRSFDTADLMVYIDEGSIVAAKPTRLDFNASDDPTTTAGPTKKPILTAPKPPKISDDDLKKFDIVPPPIPTPRPEPTEAPVPPAQLAPEPVIPAP